MTVFWNLLYVFLRAFLPALFERKPDTMEDARPQTELRDRLRNRVRATWGRTAAVAILLLTICSASGCWFQSTRTVYVKDGQPVRIRETIKNAKVWVMGADGNPVAGKMDLAEGWYALPMADDDIPLGPINSATPGKEADPAK
jgi:hypothetical protein